VQAAEVPHKGHLICRPNIIGGSACTEQSQPFCFSHLDSLLPFAHDLCEQRFGGLHFIRKSYEGRVVRESDIANHRESLLACETLRPRGLKAMFGLLHESSIHLVCPLEAGMSTCGLGLALPPRSEILEHCVVENVE
jgi:hypothetical protein